MDGLPLAITIITIFARTTFFCQHHIHHSRLFLVVCRRGMYVLSCSWRTVDHGMDGGCRLLAVSYNGLNLRQLQRRRRRRRRRQRTTNNEQRTTNDERRTTNDEPRIVTLSLSFVVVVVIRSHEPVHRPCCKNSMSQTRSRGRTNTNKQTIDGINDQ